MYGVSGFEFGAQVLVLGVQGFGFGICTGVPDAIRKKAWPFYRTGSGVRLYWELEESKGPEGVRGFGLEVWELGFNISSCCV